MGVSQRSGWDASVQPHGGTPGLDGSRVGHQGTAGAMLHACLLLSWACSRSG